MRVTVRKEEPVLKEGDIIKSDRGRFYMVVTDIEGYFILINLSTFKQFSERFRDASAVLSGFFMTGFTIYPSEKNELLIGGCE